MVVVDDVGGGGAVVDVVDVVDVLLGGGAGQLPSTRLVLATVELPSHDLART